MSLGILTSSIRVLKNLKNSISYERIAALVGLSGNTVDPALIRERKTKIQLILLSAAVCGIEFCYAAETAFVSPTLLKIGVKVVYMTLIWCLSPLLGFFLVPVLGSMSDRCRSRLGRRRPFILLLSTGIMVGLVFVPNGKSIGIALGDKFAPRVSVQDNNYPTENVSMPSQKAGLNESIHLNASLPVMSTRIPSNSSTHVNVSGGGSTGDQHMNDSGGGLLRDQQAKRGRISWSGKEHAYPNITQSKNETLKEEEKESHHWSILFTVIGVVLLDFSCDACQSPCRAYLLDVTLPEDHSAGLSTFTVMAGLGGSVGYIMGGINWEATSFGESLGGHVRVVFTLVLFIYVICLCLTVNAVREIPLDKLGRNIEDQQRSKKRVQGQKYKKFTNEDDDEDEPRGKDYGTITVPDNPNFVNPSDSVHTNYNKYQMDGELASKVWPEQKAKLGGPVNDWDTGFSYQKNSTLGGKTEAKIDAGNTDEMSIAPDGTKRRATMTAFEIEPLPSEVSLKTYLLSIVRMPRSLLILCLTNLFCWMSLVCYSLYFTDFVGEAVYGGNPSAPRGSEARELYEAGVRHGALGMSLYSISCSIYSFTIERLVKKFRAKPVYICGQLVYTVGMIVMALWRHPVAVILLSPTAGIMYATLFTMPYLLVAHYHANDTFEEAGDKRSQRNQVRGLGTDIAVVSSMVFVAQFILSLCIGSIVHAARSTVAVVVSASVLSFCGAVTATQVLYLDL